MTYTKTNWVANVTPVTAVSMNNIESGIAQLSAATSTTPPGSPVDGQLWYLPVDAANGIVWVFRYNAGSASAYKWEFVGGQAVLVEAVATVAMPSTGAWTWGTAPYVDFVVPRAGDYRAHALTVMGGPVCTNYLGVSSAGAGATSIGMIGIASNASGAYVQVATIAAIPGIILGSTLRLTHFANAVTSYSNRQMSVTPVRVS